MPRTNIRGTVPTSVNSGLSLLLPCLYLFQPVPDHCISLNPYEFALHRHDFFRFPEHRICSNLKANIDTILYVLTLPALLR